MGAYLLRENATLAGLQKRFSILDKDESISFIKKAMKAEDYDPKDIEPRKILSIISKEKGRGTQPNDLAIRELSYMEGIALRVWERYEKLLRDARALDFDDLLLRAVVLFQKNPELLARYQKRWSYLHVDEYQDTNHIQYLLARMLARPRENICVVGDIDQSIYSWRGADFRNVLNFENDYPNAKVILLEENYRSTKNILAAAESVIEKNKKRKDKRLFTENKTGAKITLYPARNEIDEALFITETAHSLLRNGVSTHDIAVLYRANFQSRVLEEAFLSSGIPYQVLGTRFFERKEIKDMLAFIHAALDSENLHALERIINTPPRGAGKVTRAKVLAGRRGELAGETKKNIDALFALLEHIKERSRTSKVSELIMYALKESGLEEYLLNSSEDDIERLENIKELVTLATKYDALSIEDALEKFLLDTSLLASDEEGARDKNGVKLMTAHSAKGLEFSYVFIAGLEDGLFPHARGKDESIDEEEERRLFYVALTRAKEKLYLSYAQERMIYGARAISLPSEFIFDISEDLLEGREVAERTIYL